MQFGHTEKVLGSIDYQRGRQRSQREMDSRNGTDSMNLCRNDIDSMNLCRSDSNSKRNQTVTVSAMLFAVGWLVAAVGVRDPQSLCPESHKLEYFERKVQGNTNGWREFVTHMYRPRAWKMDWVETLIDKRSI